MYVKQSERIKANKLEFKTYFRKYFFFKHTNKTDRHLIHGHSDLRESAVSWQPRIQKSTCLCTTLQTSIYKPQSRSNTPNLTSNKYFSFIKIFRILFQEYIIGLSKKKPWTSKNDFCDFYNVVNTEIINWGKLFSLSWKLIF